LDHVENAGGVVTASIGVAAIMPLTRTESEPAFLLGEADKALYGAKRAGRNRVGGMTGVTGLCPTLVAAHRLALEVAE
jgi:PleD family two-component response regulator